MRHKSRAFTIIEMLVVVVIITALVAILLPVFASLRKTARKNASRAQIVGLAAVCTEYKLQQKFAPGFVSDDELSKGGVWDKFTSTENLVLSLLGGVVAKGKATSPATGFTMADLGTDAAQFDIDIDAIGSGPQMFQKDNLTNVRPFGAYYSPKPGELVTIDGTTGNDNNMPELVDMPSEGMPILYLRRGDSKGERPVRDDTTGDYRRNVVRDYVEATNLETKIKGVAYNQRENSMFSEFATNGSANGSSKLANDALSWYVTSPGLSRVRLTGTNAQKAESANDDYGNSTTQDVLMSESFMLISPGPDGLYAAPDTADSLYITNYGWFDITDDQVISGD